MSSSSSGTGPAQGRDALWMAIRKDRMLSLSITEPDVATTPTLRANLDDAVGKTYEKYCQLVGERLDAIPITDQDRFSVIVEQLEHFSPSHSLDARGIPELEMPFKEIQDLADFPEMYVPRDPPDLMGAFRTFVADRIHEHGRHLEEANRDPVLRDKLLAEGIDKIKTLEKRAGLASSEEAMKQAQEQARMRAEQAQRQRAAGGAIPVAEVPHGIGGPPEMADLVLELENAGRLQFLPFEVYALDLARRGVLTAMSPWQVYALDLARRGLRIQLLHEGPEWRASRAVVLEAVRQSGLELEYAAPELQADREIVLEAVQRHGEALEYAAPALQDDLEIVQAAIGNNADAIMFASPRLQAQLRS